jgi:hypothetical protein
MIALPFIALLSRLDDAPSRLSVAGTGLRGQRTRACRGALTRRSPQFADLARFLRLKG